MMTVAGHQSLEMACEIKIATALAVLLAIANAGPSPFPRDRSLVYNYYGDVKAGIIEPAAYASQYGISGRFNIKPVDSEPDYPNSFVVALRDIKTGLYNGLAEHYQKTKAFRELPEPAKVLEDPFLIAYDENGQLGGVKISPNEPGWSKNMKLAMASMLQLDISSMNLNSPIKHQSFMSKENTIHGDCWTSYDVHAKDYNAVEDRNEFIITKFGSPRNCTNYNVFTFNNAEIEKCDLPPERPVNMASRRVFQAEKRGQDILIKSLIAHGGVNYFPWRGQSEAHYVLNNASFVLLEDAPSDFGSSLTDFREVPLITDISYQRPQDDNQGTSLDITQGRHSVDRESLASELKNLLMEAADYLDENHLEAKEPDSKHGQIINRIVNTMSLMTSPLLQEVFSEMESPGTSKEQTIKNVFLEVLPHVGTSASISTAIYLISEPAVDNLSAIQMLANLPLNVRNPTTESLELIDPLLDMTRFHNVRGAIIPNVANLVFRTFKNTAEPEKNSVLNRYIDFFYNLVIDGEYHDKVAALAALRNIQIGTVFDRLAPLIRAEVPVNGLDKDTSTNLRLHAIWAVEKSIPSYQAAHDLLWPIMADSNLSVKLRIAAYDILIRQAPTMTNFLHIYWFMVYEKNEHLYNYHHTTIKGIANSVDPCDMYAKELATKIMRFTKIHAPVPYKLSASYMVNGVDQIYGHGDQFSVSYTLNEETGALHVLNIESSVMEGRRRVNVWKVQLTLAHMNAQMASLFPFREFRHLRSITNEDVKQILELAGRNVKLGNFEFDTVVSYKGRVVFANAYVGEQVMSLLPLLEPLFTFDRRFMKVNRQFVSYDKLYQQHVVSEMGLPVLLESKIPAVTSIIGQIEKLDGTQLRFKNDVDYKEWRHGDYSMSIYNPLLDAWHSIRRTTATDAQFSFQFTSDFEPETHTLESTIPILPLTKHSGQGMVTHAKDVTVVTDDDGVLKESCPSCEYYETVTRGISAKKNHEKVHDIQDLGLQYSTAVFDCETGLTPVLIYKDMFRSLIAERKNGWSRDWISQLLAYRQSSKNLINSPRMGSCGVMSKLEPSTKYPTSHVLVSVKANAETEDADQGILHLLQGSKLNIRGNLQAFSAITKAPTRTWHMNMNIDVNREHRLSRTDLHLIRSGPGEKNLVICIEAQKLYPSIPEDPLKVGVTQEETHSKLIFSMAETDETKCSSDQTLITINVEGELSEEQKKKFIQESISGDCKADIDNPLYSNAENLIPRTVNCLEHAMRFTTLRKYTITVNYANVPESILYPLRASEDEFKAFFYPHLVYTTTHTDEGTMVMVVKFPMALDKVNVSVATADRGWDIVGAEISEESWTGFERYPPRLEGFGPNPDKHLWMSPLDNTRFPLKFLRAYRDSEINLCSLYPKVVVTADGGEIPYEMSDTWTLASGDKIYQVFAVFVKSVNNVMGVKLFSGFDVVEFSPRANDYSLQINGEEFAVSKMINGTFVPEEDQYSWSFKLTSYGGVNTIEIKDTPVVILHSLNSVTLLINRGLQGGIAGLCGNLDGQTKTKLPGSSYFLP